MSVTFDHHPWSVQELVSGVHSGQVRLPDMQRQFLWSNTKVRDLLDSMYKGFSVGELMFWANRSGEHSHAIRADRKLSGANSQRRRDAKTDWSVKEQVHAKLRATIKRLLLKYGYPQDQETAATQLVLDQAEVIAGEQSE